MNINPKMTGKNQSDQDSADSVAPGVFWGTIALNGITLLVYAYIFNLLLQQTKALGIYGAITVMFFAILAAIAGIVLTVRHRQDLGLKLSLYPILVVGIIIISIFQGRTLAASFSILIISVVANLWLLQRHSRRRHLIVTILALIGMWVIEWINPAWRVSVNAASVGPVGALVFLTIFGAAVGSRVLRANLRTKLVSAFLLVTLVPMAIISYLNYRSTTQALVQAANVKIAGAAQFAADQVDSFFKATLNTTLVKAQDPVIVDYLLLPSYQRAGSAEEAQVYKLLQAYSHEDPLFVNSIGVIDTIGRSLADTSQDEIGVDKHDRVYFRQPLETGLPYSSELIFSATTGKPSLYFTAPVRNPADGNIIGVFRIRYDAAILQTIVAKNTGLAGDESLPVLLDENHIRLAHGVLPDLDYKTIVPLSADALAKLQANNSLPSGTAEQLSTNLPDLEAGLNNVDKQPFFIAELHTEAQGGGTEETTAVRLKSHPWIMVFGQTGTVFLAPIQAQTRNSLIIAIVLALLVAGFGFFIAQTMAGPVVRLTAVAERIAAGDIQAQAQVETVDEIGLLAGTFNQMTAQLREFIGTLEQRVAARTKDLEIVAEVGTATATILESKRLLQEVVDLTKERFNLYHSHIYLLDGEGKNLVLTSGAGEPGRIMVAEGRSIPLDREQSLVARAARERKGVTVNDVTQAPDFLPNTLLPDTRSELAVPMIVGNQVIGVFDIQSDQVGRFTESDVNIQTTLAAQLATSIQNVRSFEQSRRQAEFESLTNMIGQRIQRTTSIEESLQTAIREIGLALGASRVSASIGNSRQNSDRGN
jgi:putative methionine-R-sulfoxide reductase with GAF domain